MKFISLRVSKDYIKDMPVSEAPTTTIRVLLLILMLFRFFFEIIDKEKGAYYWSKGSLSKSTPPLFSNLLYRSYFYNWKFHFLFSSWGKVLSRSGVNSLNISGNKVLLWTSKYKHDLFNSLIISLKINRTDLINNGLINECITFPCLSLGC